MLCTLDYSCGYGQNDQLYVLMLDMNSLAWM